MASLLHLRVPHTAQKLFVKVCADSDTRNTIASIRILKRRPVDSRLGTLLTSKSQRVLSPEDGAKWKARTFAAVEKLTGLGNNSVE